MVTLAHSKSKYEPESRSRAELQEYIKIRQIRCKPTKVRFDPNQYVEIKPDECGVQAKYIGDFGYEPVGPNIIIESPHPITNRRIRVDRVQRQINRSGGIKTFQ